MLSSALRRICAVLCVYVFPALPWSVTDAIAIDRKLCVVPVLSGAMGEAGERYELDARGPSVFPGVAVAGFAPLVWRLGQP